MNNLTTEIKDYNRGWYAKGEALKTAIAKWHNECDEIKSIYNSVTREWRFVPEDVRKPFFTVWDWNNTVNLNTITNELNQTLHNNFSAPNNRFRVLSGTLAVSTLLILAVVTPFSPI